MHPELQLDFARKILIKKVTAGEQCFSKSEMQSFFPLNLKICDKIDTETFSGKKNREQVEVFGKKLQISIVFN